MIDNMDISMPYHLTAPDPQEQVVSCAYRDIGVQCSGGFTNFCNSGTMTQDMPIVTNDELRRVIESLEPIPVTTTSKWTTMDAVTAVDTARYTYPLRPYSLRIDNVSATTSFRCP